MLICQCNAISDRDVDAAIDWMRAADPDTLITPGKIFRALGKSPDCGGCMPLFLTTMRANGNLQIPAVLCGLRDSQRGARHERRREGHRISQSGDPV